MPKVDVGGFLANKNKVNLTNADIFDKVINLKITAMEVSTGMKESYVIRSDYEIIYDRYSYSALMRNKDLSGAGGVIRKCEYKPGIKVQYKQVSQSTSIAIDIYVTNFYAIGNNGSLLLNFNTKEYKVVKVEIAMGYFGQFQNLKPTMQTYDNFDVFKNNAYGITYICSDCEYLNCDKLTPDAVAHLHCFVGNYTNEALVTPTQPTTETAENLDAVFNCTDSSTLDDYMESCVTKRYFADTSLTPLEQQAKIDPVTNTLLSSSDGVPVYCSNGALSLFKEITSEKLTGKDSSGNSVTLNRELPIPNGLNILNSLSKSLQQISPSLRYTQLGNGGFAVYTQDEYVNNFKNLYDEFSGKNALPKGAIETFNNLIPAVYNITAEGLCTISCPFFCTVDTFSKVIFNSRYALGKLVTYFGSRNATGATEYIVISSSVSFATTEPINEMILSTVANKG